MFNRRLLKNFDFGLLITVILISALSIIVISSASHAAMTGSYKKVAVQFVAIIVGLISLFIVNLFDYNIYPKFATYIYIANILVLLSVLFIGRVSHGARSWIYIGPICIEPAEFSKLALIITLAKKFNDMEEIKSFKELLSPLVHVGIPFIIVMLQPNLGMALVFLAIFIGMVFISGIKPRVFTELIAAGIAFIPIAYEILKPYQRNRLLSFINPNLDPMGSGYHVVQSKIAVGSGMFWGKGLFNGSQTQLYFLPEAWTDFIFSVISEELGFIGAFIIILLYGILLYKAWRIAFMAKDKYGRLVAAGILSMFSFHILENIGMTIGIMPVAGITLPFMSYGGSSMVLNMIAIGILLNIGMRRQKINF